MVGNIKEGKLKMFVERPKGRNRMFKPFLVEFFQAVTGGFPLLFLGGGNLSRNDITKIFSEQHVDIKSFVRFKMGLHFPGKTAR